MTHAATAEGFHGRVAIRTSEEQARAFDQARRHSTRVRFYRRSIVLGSAGFLIGFVAYMLIDPFSRLPKDVSIAKATMNGTRITMEQPKLSGFRRDGRPYTVRARSGVQDIRKPKIIELNHIEATIKINVTDTVNVTAPRGVFDSDSDVMELRTGDSESRIRVKSTNYSILLKSADVNFKSGTVLSNEPVNVQLTNGTITADRLNVSDNGKMISFSGNVRSVLKAPQKSKNSRTRPASEKKRETGPDTAIAPGRGTLGQ